MMDLSLNALILSHARNDALAADVAKLYSELDETIAGHNPTCWNYGKCCRFGAYGHRLYVSTAELAFFVRGRAADWISPTEEAACPWQVEGKCTAREHRPLGCRIFFCDPNSQDWQNDEYEQRLNQLKRIGEAHNLPYRYQEWLSALAETGLEASCAGQAGETCGGVAAGKPNVDPATATVVELPQVRGTDSHR